MREQRGSVPCYRACPIWRYAVANNDLIDSRIMVIEDDSDIRDMMDVLLTMHGYQTILHPSAQDAAERVRDQQPALVIVDMHMDYRDAGLHILRELRADPRTAAIPVLVCSAEYDVEHTVTRLDLTNVEVLQKPFLPDQFFDTITTLLNPPSGA